MENLTVEELDTLIEALDAWTTADRSDRMLVGLIIGAMVSKEDSSAGAKFFEGITDGTAEKMESRKEVATLLKAKLIKMRDALMVQEVSREL